MDSTSSTLAPRRPAEIAADLERVFTLFPVLRERQWQQSSTLPGGEQRAAGVEHLVGHLGRGQHRRPVLGVAGLYIQPAGCQQRSNGLACVILQGNREPHLPLGVTGVRIKAPAQQRSDCIPVIAQDGYKKIFIGTGPSPGRHQAQRHSSQGTQCKSKTNLHDSNSSVRMNERGIEPDTKAQSRKPVPTSPEKCAL